MTERSYVVEHRALLLATNEDEYVYEITVWQYTYTSDNRAAAPPFICARTNVQANHDTVYPAAQAFLELVKIRREG